VHELVDQDLGLLRLRSFLPGGQLDPARCFLGSRHDLSVLGLRRPRRRSARTPSTTLKDSITTLGEQAPRLATVAPPGAQAAPNERRTNPT
jgi:hypothetical protein